MDKKHWQSWGWGGGGQRQTPPWSLQSRSKWWQ